jgi:hypothetical protein
MPPKRAPRAHTQPKLKFIPRRDAIVDTFADESNRDRGTLAHAFSATLNARRANSL